MRADVGRSLPRAVIASAVRPLLYASRNRPILGISYCLALTESSVELTNQQEHGQKNDRVEVRCRIAFSVS